MGRKKNQDEPPKEPDVNATQGTSRSADRHKNKRMARIPDELYDGLQRLAQQNDRPWGWELRRAIEAHLRAEGIIPDADEGAGEDGS